MTAAIFIKDGTTQLVLTPETEWEKRVVAVLSDGEHKLSVMRGSFYECRGGWVRFSGNSAFDRQPDDASLILRVDKLPDVPA